MVSSLIKQTLALCAVLLAMIAGVGWWFGGSKANASNIQQPVTYQTVTRTFTAAEMQSMFTTPIQIIPAPGPGYAVVPGPTGSVFLDYQTTPYTFNPAASFFVSYHGIGLSGSIWWLNLNSSGFFDQTIPGIYFSNLSNDMNEQNFNDISVLENLGVDVSIQSQPLMAGDSPVVYVQTYYIQKIRP